MKTNIRMLSANVPRNDYDPSDDGKRLIPIATPGGDLMMNRLRRLLRLQDQTKNNEDGYRFTLEIPSELTLQVVEAYHKKSKAMGRMDKALDRKTQEIDELEDELCEMYGQGVVMDLVLGSFTDLLDVARDFSMALASNKNQIPQKELDALNDQIAASTEMLDELVEADEEDETEEETD